MARGLPGRYVSNVAQSCTLPCRRFVIGRASAWPNASAGQPALQDSILRYGRVQLCATRWRAVSLLYSRGELCEIEHAFMKPTNVRLFIKPYCGWCSEAQEWLVDRGIAHETLDVISDPVARKEMIELSGQTLAPVIEVDGEILADFDTDQLAVFWNKLEQA
jgi:glutaredoxin 3